MASIPSQLRLRFIKSQKTFLPTIISYLAAVTDDCCRRHHWVLPQWCIKQERFLTEPFFAAKTHALRMLYVMDSPAAFRERNIFVSARAY